MHLAVQYIIFQAYFSYSSSLGSGSPQASGNSPPISQLVRTKSIASKVDGFEEIRFAMFGASP